MRDSFNAEFAETNLKSRKAIGSQLNVKPCMIKDIKYLRKNIK